LLWRAVGQAIAGQRWTWPATFLLVARLENVEIAFAAWSSVQRSRRAERSIRLLRGYVGLCITKAGGRS
jgi:hypothetical protein